MSAYVLRQEEINLLTQATNAVLELNKKYSGSYPLSENTTNILSKYAGDLHSIYRALYITNIKAVNGRYGDNQKTLPKYKPLRSWDLERMPIFELKKACGAFGCYMYQCSEDPIDGSDIWKAFSDIYKTCCMLYVNKTIDWQGNDDL